METSLVDTVLRKQVTADLEGQFRSEIFKLRERLNGVSNFRRELIEEERKRWEDLGACLNALEDAYVAFFLPFEVANCVKVLLSSPATLSSIGKSNAEQWGNLGRELQELQEKQGRLSAVVDETYGIAVSARARVTQLEGEANDRNVATEAEDGADLVNVNG